MTGHTEMLYMFSGPMLFFSMACPASFPSHILQTDWVSSHACVAGRQSAYEEVLEDEAKLGL